MRNVPVWLPVVSVLVLSVPWSSVRAEDAAAPSQDLATDRASNRPLFQAMAVARVPLDRSYGVAVAYSPARPLALELRIAIDESASVELGVGVSLYVFGKAYDGLLVRTTPQAVLSEDGTASKSRLRVDFELGYALATGNFVVEFDLGAAYRRSRGSTFAILVGVRAGVAY